MSNKNYFYLLIVVFSIFLLIFILLFSYKSTLAFTDLTFNQEQTINFLQGNSLLGLNYTSLEKEHLEDVKIVMKFVNYCFYFSLLICTLILTYYHRDKKSLRQLIFYGGLVVFAFTMIVFLFLLFNFNGSFTVFHQIFFPQGNWQFSSTSLLIQTFPLDFFIHLGRSIFIISFLGGIIFIGISYLLKDDRHQRD